MSARLHVTLALVLALGWLTRPAAAQTVTLVLPTLPAKRTGPPVRPDVALEPVLRVGVGQIRDVSGFTTGISTDSSGRFATVVQGGAEVLVRALDGGSPDVVLRPPVPANGTPLISTATISANGAVVAVAWASDTSAAIFLFDRATGGIIQRIDGPVDIVSDLRFSKDGAILAAAIGSGGVQVFDTRTGEELGRDLDYASRTYSVDISLDGRALITASGDRKLRLYSFQYGRIQLRGTATAGSVMLQSSPATARFSPDGQLIAVGFDRGAGLEIWKSATLTKSDDLMLPFSMLNNAYALAWSADGEQVYAPSIGFSPGFKILVWTRGRTVKPDDLGFNLLSERQDISFEAHGFPRGFAPLPDGRVLAITQSGAVALAAPSGAVTWRVESHAVRYDGYFDLAKPPRILLSADGKIVQFPNDLNNKSAAVFDPVARAFRDTATGLSGPTTKNAYNLNVNMTGIFGLSDPSKRATLNGAPLAMPPKEFATSYAVSPGGQFIAVSTSGAIRVYSKSGAPIWSRQGGAVTVNISADGRLVVADDGAIRWFRASDGTPLLSMLPSADHRRWVAWTPSGYYDASPGGDDMVEWQVNRGLSQPSDIYPLSRFADVMRRPDIVSRVLDTLDESLARTQADQAAGRTATRIAEFTPPPAAPPAGASKPPAKHPTAPAETGPPPSAPRPTIYETTLITPRIVAELLPPIIDLVQAPSVFSSDAVTIRYRVRVPADAPMVGAPRVLVNEQWQPRSRAASQIAPDVRTLVVGGLPQRDSVIQIFADNQNGPSAPLTITLKWAGQGATPAPVAPPASRKPRLFVLAIGVSTYARPELKLNFADHDAEQVAAAMAAQQGRAYASVTSKVILNGQATRAAVQQGLAWLESQVAADDVGVLFLAGHGFDTSDGYYFFAPTDFDPSQPRQTGVDYKSIRNALVQFAGKGNKAIFLIDTCYSGGALGANNTASTGESLATSLSSQFSLVGMTSSTRLKPSVERIDWGDGAFTKALLEGIVQGRADAAQTGEITMLGLGGYVSQRVKSLTQQAQTPVFMAPSGLEDFAVALH